VINEPMVPGWVVLLMYVLLGCIILGGVLDVLR
jgi:hypothetical protein